MARLRAMLLSVELLYPSAHAASTAEGCTLPFLAEISKQLHHRSCKLMEICSSEEPTLNIYTESEKYGLVTFLPVFHVSLHWNKEIQFFTSIFIQPLTPQWLFWMSEAILQTAVLLEITNHSQSYWS